MNQVIEGDINNNKNFLHETNKNWQLHASTFFIQRHKNEYLNGNAKKELHEMQYNQV